MVLEDHPGLNGTREGGGAKLAKGAPFNSGSVSGLKPPLARFHLHLLILELLIRKDRLLRIFIFYHFKSTLGFGFQHVQEVKGRGSSQIFDCIEPAFFTVSCSRDIGDILIISMSQVLVTGLG